MTMVTEYDFETNTMTHPAPRSAFRATVAEVAARAKERLPEAVNSRVERAVTLVLAQDVTPQADGTIEVGSSSDPLKVYRLVGATCDCQDFTHGKAPSGWCAHRIAAGIQKRVQELLPPSPTVETAPTPAPPVAVDASAAPSPARPRQTIPAKYIQKLQGKDFVRFAGLLQAAQAEGLVELSAVWTANTDQLSTAQAVAIFADGRRYEESGDSSPQNARNIGLHWRRMALTRAKARCLRDALGIEECSVEELD